MRTAFSRGILKPVVKFHSHFVRFECDACDGCCLIGLALSLRSIFEEDSIHLRTGCDGESRLPVATGFYYEPYERFYPKAHPFLYRRYRRSKFLGELFDV